MTNRNNITTKKRDRSTAYPAISLDKAINYAEKLDLSFGSSPFSREHGIKEIGHNTITGASAGKIAALVHYGLLDRTGNSYQISNLAFRVLHPIDEETKNNLIKEAASKPKLFQTLITQFSGKAIPGALNNILIVNHKIGRNVANQVVKIFKDTITFANLYSNGILSSINTEDTGKPLDETKTFEPNLSLSQIKPNLTSQKTEVTNTLVSELLSIKLPSGIIIQYPEKLGYFFAIGRFGTEIEALNKAIQISINEIDKEEK